MSDGDVNSIGRHQIQSNSDAKSDVMRSTEREKWIKKANKGTNEMTKRKTRKRMDGVKEGGNLHKERNILETEGRNEV